MNWKRPVEHLEFVGPGSVLLSVSLFGLIAAVSTLPAEDVFSSWYFIAGLTGAAVAILILLKTKVGTALLLSLLVPLGCCIVWLINSNRFSSQSMLSGVLLSYVIVANGRRQIRYHCEGRENEAEQGGAPNR